MSTQYVKGINSDLVTLKSRLMLTQGAIRKPGCVFLYAFYSNYGAILYRLRDIATYWWKIAKFLYPTCI